VGFFMIASIEGTPLVPHEEASFGHQDYAELLRTLNAPDLGRWPLDTGFSA
jgi:hypothetical protein